MLVGAYVWRTHFVDSRRPSVAHKKNYTVVPPDMPPPVIWMQPDSGTILEEKK